MWQPTHITTLQLLEYPVCCVPCAVLVDLHSSRGLMCDQNAAILSYPLLMSIPHRLVVIVVFFLFVFSRVTRSHGDYFVDISRTAQAKSSSTLSSNQTHSCLPDIVLCLYEDRLVISLNP